MKRQNQLDSPPPMTQLSDRRVLTFPAIHPCQSVYSTTLLHALITLSHEIVSFRSTPFPIHRRNVRETLREVGVLLTFFEEIRDHGSALPDSVILSFSELHITLQKIRHLLHDCARRGTHLWVLMNSNRVSGEFRIFIRSIATVLDVLPLASIDVDVEIKELVQLVARQAWEVAIETDPEDDRAARDVRSILNQFELGVSADPSNLKRVLNHLRIRSWTECDEEVWFLEEEICLATSSEDDDNAALLSSLMGFMVYCRSVLFFDVLDGKRGDRKEFKFQGPGFAINHLNPEDFRCPISLEFMIDPVTISTGQTYDRTSIVKWLKTGCLTCPVTGEKLVNTKLVPNSTIANLVRQLFHDHNIPISKPSRRSRDLATTLSPRSSAAASATRMVADFLVNKLLIGAKKEKNKAAYEIRLLTKSSLFNRACFVQSGSVPQLLNLISSPDPSTQDNAVATILNLSKHPDGRILIFEPGGLSPILDVLRKGHRIEAQQNAAAILFYLSSVEEYRREIGELEDSIPALVDMLRNGTYRGKKNAVVTVFGLLLFPGNHPKVLAAGTISVLSDLLSTESEDLVHDSLGVLAKIAERSEGSKAILRSSTVPLLVEILVSSASRAGKEYCVSILLYLCNNDGAKVVKMLDALPSLMPSLYSLLTDGSPQTGKKARSLLSCLHHFHEQTMLPFLTRPVQDRVVHAL